MQRSFIGVDVAKYHLDVALYGQDKPHRFSNDDAGISDLMAWLSDHTINLVVAEATGGLELPLLLCLHEAGYPVARVNPRWIKDFARAGGQRAKTDALDAALIAHYGAVMQPQVWEPLDEDGWSFKDLCARRRQLVGMMTMEKNRHGQCKNAHVTRQHQTLLIVLGRQLKEIEQVLAQLIERSYDRRTKAEIITSVPGIAQTTAITLLAELPELGRLNSKQIAALVGLAPFDNQSGGHNGYQRIFAGRSTIRKVLYMVAVGMCRRNNPHFKAFYENLVQKGKHKKVALVAIMRKIIVTLNAMVKNKTLWKTPLKT